MISGSAALSAAVAAPRLPDAMASSTLRMKLRMRLCRARLTAVCRSILRTIFFAECVLAIAVSSSQNWGGSRKRGLYRALPSGSMIGAAAGEPAP